MRVGDDPDSNTVLEFRDIVQVYGSRTLLDGLHLSVPRGDFMVIYGPPATGKSVLLRLLMGLEPPSGGQIVLRGRNVTGIPAAERNIGYVPQSFALYPHLSVHDNIAYPLKLAGLNKSGSEPIVRRAAEMLKIGDLLGKRPDQLSGGQKQRVAIARGIAKQTEIYVLDDPLAGLDFKLREQLVDDLKTLQEETRATFIYTTSDPIEALTLADHLAVLDGGRIVEAGEPERLYRQPGHARTMALLGFPRANLLPGTLTAANGRWRCQTDLFEFAVVAEAGALDGATDRDVVVGLRPEDVLLDTAAAPVGAARFAATITLREDLGGEEIVYLDAGQMALTTVVRLAEQETATVRETGGVTANIRAGDLVVFAADGTRIGHGEASEDETNHG